MSDNQKDTEQDSLRKRTDNRKNNSTEIAHAARNSKATRKETVTGQLFAGKNEWWEQASYKEITQELERFQQSLVNLGGKRMPLIDEILADEDDTKGKRYRRVLKELAGNKNPSN